MFSSMPSEEYMRKARESIAAKEGVSEDEEIVIFLQDAQGRVIIDSPKAVKVLSEEPGWPEEKEMQKTTFTASNGENVPLHYHPNFRSIWNQTSEQSSEENTQRQEEK